MKSAWEKNLVSYSTKVADKKNLALSKFEKSDNCNRGMKRSFGNVTHDTTTLQVRGLPPTDLNNFCLIFHPFGADK